MIACAFDSVEGVYYFLFLFVVVLIKLLDYSTSATSESLRRGSRETIAIVSKVSSTKLLCASVWHSNNNTALGQDPWDSS